MSVIIRGRERLPGPSYLVPYLQVEMVQTDRIANSRCEEVDLPLWSQVRVLSNPSLSPSPQDSPTGPL